MSRGRLVQLGLVGAAAGLFSGLFGVGGGVVIVPLLVLWLLFDERTATGTSLLAIAVVAAVGAVVQEVAYGNVLVWDGVLVGLPAVAGVLFGVWLQHHIPAAWVRILFAVLLVGTAIALVAGNGWEPAAGSGGGAGYYLAAAAIGLAAGVLSGLLVAQDEDQRRHEEGAAAHAEEAAEEPGGGPDQGELDEATAAHGFILGIGMSGEMTLEEALAPVVGDPSRAAVLLDVDGTLAPIVRDPEDASVSELFRRLLVDCTASYALVGCVSGRQASEARRIVGIVPLLVLWLLFDERTATGTSLLAIAAVAAAGAIVQELAYGNVLFWDGVLEPDPEKDAADGRQPDQHPVPEEHVPVGELLDDRAGGSHCGDGQQRGSGRRALVEKEPED
ncbi:MAG: TSUP family transporter, partial [Solirubrobacterales bacterium]